MTLNDYYRHIYTLSFINRYTNRIRVRNEDVAQHSFFVAAIILKLYEDYDFDLGIALQAAISHDITEADLSDVTHDVKKKNPKLAREINEAEYKELKKYPLAVIDGFSIFDTMHGPEGLIANLADVIQVSQYVQSERSLGNSNMEDIDSESRTRLWKLRKELKKYVRPGKNPLIQK